MRKYLLCLFLVGAITPMFFACGSKQDTTTPNQVQSSQPYGQPYGQPTYAQPTQQPTTAPTTPPQPTTPFGIPLPTGIPTAIPSGFNIPGLPLPGHS